MNKRIQMLIMEMKHDRKKFVMMCTLLVVGLLLWARLLILQDVPKTGFADPGEEETANQSTRTGQAQGTENSHLEELPIVYLDTDSQLRSNFFSPLTSTSMQSEEVAQVPLTGPKSQLESPEDAEADLRKRQVAFHADAQRLKLESVILGRSPVAVINGKVLRVGQFIDGFVLESVSTRHVVLRRGEFRVDLKMEQPQSGG